MKQLQYDTSYPICADYEFYQRAYACGKRYRYIGRPICYYQLGGISYQRAFDLLDEAYDIQLKYGVISEKEHRVLKRRNHRKRVSRQLLPSGLYAKLKAWKRQWEKRNWDDYSQQ